VFDEMDERDREPSSSGELTKRTASTNALLSDERAEVAGNLGGEPLGGGA
jgi:hypothetical protein